MSRKSVEMEQANDLGPGGDQPAPTELELTELIFSTTESASGCVYTDEDIDSTESGGESEFVDVDDSWVDSGSNCTSQAGKRDLSTTNQGKEEESSAGTQEGETEIERRADAPTGELPHDTSYTCHSCGVRYLYEEIGSVSTPMPLIGDERAQFSCAACVAKSGAATRDGGASGSSSTLARFDFPERRSWAEIAFVALTNLALMTDGCASPIDGTFHHLQSVVVNFIYQHYDILCTGYSRNCWKSHLATALNTLPSHFEHSEGQQGRGWWRLRYKAHYPTSRDKTLPVRSQTASGASTWRRNRRPPHRPSDDIVLPLPVRTHRKRTSSDAGLPNSSKSTTPSSNNGRQPNHELVELRDLFPSTTRVIYGHENRTLSPDYGSTMSHLALRRADSQSETSLAGPRSTSSSSTGSSTPRYTAPSLTKLRYQSNFTPQSKTKTAISFPSSVSQQPVPFRSPAVPPMSSASTTHFSQVHHDRELQESTRAEWHLIESLGPRAVQFVRNRLMRIPAAQITPSILRDLRMACECAITLSQIDTIAFAQNPFYSLRQALQSTGTLSEMMKLHAPPRNTGLFSMPHYWVPASVVPLPPI